MLWAGLPRPLGALDLLLDRPEALEVFVELLLAR
jgi:hypothetical protein